MRIGILKESLCFGGTERSTANISKILCEDHDVYVALYDRKNIKYEYGGELVDFKLPAKKNIICKVINNLFRILKYKIFIKDKKIDLLYEFISIKSPLSWLRHKSVIRIISSRDFAALTTYIDRYNYCLKNADAMICNSQYLREYFISKYPEQVNKVFTVYNYIDTQEIQEQGNEEVDKEFKKFLTSYSNTVVAVGRFCKEKGFEYLIQSISLCTKYNNNIGLVLVGDGEYKAKYKDIIIKHGLLDRVYFTGFQTNPYKYMKQCKIFVLSSLSEGFPNVLAEAMTLGLPVIATNCYSGPAEILKKDADYYSVKEKYVECDYGIITPVFTESNNTNAINQLAKAILQMFLNQQLYNKYSLLSFQRAQYFSKEFAQYQLNDIIRILKERKNY